MRRGTPFLAALVFVGCIIAPTAMPADPSAGPETIAVPPTMTPGAGPTTATDFVKGKRYRAVLSGTVTRTRKDGTSFLYDAVYCYSGCTAGPAPDCCGLGLFAEDPANGLQPIMYFGRPTTPNPSYPQNPKYDGVNHTYTIVIDQAQGPLHLAAQPAGAPIEGEKYSGQFRVEILPIDAVAHTCTAPVMKAPSSHGVSARLTQSSKRSVSALRLVGRIGKNVYSVPEYDRYALLGAKGTLCHRDKLDSGDVTVTFAIRDAPSNQVLVTADGSVAIRAAIEVTGTDDEACTVGTGGTVAFVNGKSKRHDELVIRMDAGCSGQSHHFPNSTRVSITRRSR